MAAYREPWKLTMDQILDSTDNLVAAQKGPSGLTKEDMQRIVLCVNACKGVPNESLASGRVALVGTSGVITNVMFTGPTIKWTNPPQKGTP